MVTDKTDWTDERHRRIIEEQRRYMWTPEQLARLATWYGLKPGMTLLDLGCGYGYVGSAYGPYVAPGGRVVGVDRECALVDEARRRAAPASCGARTDVIAGDACAVPLADASADAAFCQTLLMHLVAPERALAEMVRVVKPGGLVAANEPDHLALGSGYYSAVPFDRDVFLRDMALWLTCYEGRKKRGRGDYAIGGRVPEMMRALGLEDIDVRLNEKVYCLVPPYETPFQRHVRDMTLANIARRDEWKDEGREDYVAGGGAADVWDREWERTAARDERIGAALEAGELFATSVVAFYAFKARKPR